MDSFCTTAATIGPVGSTPEEAARLFREGIDGTSPAEAVEPSQGPAGFDRVSRTEWRRDLDSGGYHRLIVRELPDGPGWRVVDANTCS